MVIPFLTVLSELGIKSGGSTRPARSETFFRDYANFILMSSPSQLTKSDAERAGWYFYEFSEPAIWSAVEQDSIRKVVDPETSVARDVVSFITMIRAEWMLRGPKKDIDVPSALRVDGGVSTEVKLALTLISFFAILRQRMIPRKVICWTLATSPRISLKPLC
jgi:hypothetical protein